MRITRFALCVLGLAFVLAAGSSAARGEDMPDHVVVPFDSVKWQPSEFPGLSMAVLQGDPSKAGEPFTILLKAPANFKFAPHWHPTDENVFVLQGKMGLGMGDKMDDSGPEVGVGSYARVAAKAHHFAYSKEGAIFSIHAIGPFQVTFIDPKDDPRPKKSM